MFPEFDVVGFEGKIAELRKVTSGELRKQARHLKMAAYTEIAGAVLSFSAAIFAITMNVLGYPLAGILSLFGFGFLLVFSMAANEYSQVYSKDLAEICKAINGKDDQKGMELLEFDHTKITTLTIREMLKTSDKGSSLIDVVFKAFGENKKLFGGAVSIEKGLMSIKMKNGERLPIPNSGIGKFYASGHAKAVMNVATYLSL